MKLPIYFVQPWQLLLCMMAGMGQNVEDLPTLEIRSVHLVGEEVELEIQGPPNQSLLIERTTDFLEWSRAWEAEELFPADGIITARFGAFPATEAAFFRGVSLGTFANSHGLEALAGPPDARANSHLRTWLCPWKRRLT